ncbi:MAG TPA: hypothetical protein VF331_22095 [Polyangiales bacterium]
MHKHVPFLVVIVAVMLAVSALCACSSNKPAASSHSDAGTSSDAGTVRDAAPTSDGSVEAGAGLKEGDLCQMASDCNVGLACVTDSNGFGTTGICARACTSDTDCGTEICYSQTGMAADAHCVNVLRTQFVICGSGDTSICARPLTCLYDPKSTLGRCVNICPLATAATDDGGLNDAGVTADSGAASNPCDTNQTCLTDILSSTTEGVCAQHAARSKLCGSAMGIFCEGTDLCAPDDPTNPSSPRHCREDCTSTNKCSQGTCTSVGSLGVCF